jgi:Mn-containing catalase
VRLPRRSIAPGDCKPYIDRGEHLRLYRFSPDDYLELAAVWNGPHPETEEELEVVDEAPEGVPADYAPEEIAESPEVVGATQRGVRRL